MGFDEPLHSVIETIGAVPALMLALFLIPDSWTPVFTGSDFLPDYQY